MLSISDNNPNHKQNQLNLALAVACYSNGLFEEHCVSKRTVCEYNSILTTSILPKPLYNQTKIEEGLFWPGFHLKNQ